MDRAAVKDDESRMNELRCELDELVKKACDAESNIHKTFNSPHMAESLLILDMQNYEKRKAKARKAGKKQSS